MTEEYNPCLTCGACCATFRVSFYWGEADPAFGGVVPVELTERLTTSRRSMRWSEPTVPRCVALDGKIGEAVCCTIYANRPTPCRDFPYSYQDNQVNLDCDRARAKWGLPPLPPLLEILP